MAIICNKKHTKKLANGTPTKKTSCQEHILLLLVVVHYNMRVVVHYNLRFLIVRGVYGLASLKSERTKHTGAVSMSSSMFQWMACHLKATIRANSRTSKISSYQPKKAICVSR
eukprot:GHVT01049805.1.p1 GENE.GHVT01049805.1~~GHVT01049805.1.p1  ORF type:complete len:113 (+),score=5.12 GHVT01049805.1:2315-2653(+)